MTLSTLITQAQIRGASVHITRHDDGELATVQVIGLRGMTTFPLPAGQAEMALAAALNVDDRRAA